MRLRCDPFAADIEPETKDIRKPFPLCTTVNLAGTSCWRTKMSLQWQGEEERGDQIGDPSAINGKFRLDIFLKIKKYLS